MDEANNVADRYEVDLEKVKNELRKCQEQVERLGSNADTTEAGVDKPPPKHKVSLIICRASYISEQKLLYP